MSLICKYVHIERLITVNNHGMMGDGRENIMKRNMKCAPIPQRHTMPNLMLSSLENGLAALRNDAQPLIDELKAKLASRIPITDEEEAWLDHDANFTDEAMLIAELQDARDFQSTFDSLSASQRAIVQRLQTASTPKNQNLERLANAAETEWKFNPNLKRECAT